MLFLLLLYCVYIFFVLWSGYYWMNDEDEENRWKMRNKAIENSKGNKYTQSKERKRRRSIGGKKIVEEMKEWKETFVLLLFLLSSTFRMVTKRVDRQWHALLAATAFVRWISRHQKSTNGFSFCLASYKFHFDFFPFVFFHSLSFIWNYSKSWTRPLKIDFRDA